MPNGTAPILVPQAQWFGLGCDISAYAIVISCNCTKNFTKIFPAGYPTPLQPQNGFTRASLFIDCLDASGAFSVAGLCVRDLKGRYYKPLHNGDNKSPSANASFYNVFLYSVCNAKGKKCRSYFVLNCYYSVKGRDLTAGVYQVGGKKGKVPKSWTCGTFFSCVSTGDIDII